MLHRHDGTIGWNVCDQADRYNLDDITADSHGTHVNGIFALLIHYFGLEKYIKILPIKASDSTRDGKALYDTQSVYSGTGNDCALEYAKTAGADVVNMSLGVLGGSASNWASTKFTSAANQMVLVAAAGNSSTDSGASSSSLFYPAANSGVIGVMNYTRNTATGKIELASSSNFGVAYDIVAPGSNIVSSVNSSFTTTANRRLFAGSGEHDNYGTLTGTSMSAPFVSFAAALLCAKYRAFTHKEGTDEPTPSVLATMLTGYTCPTLEVQSKANPTRKYALNLLDYNALLNTDFLDDDGNIYVYPSAISIEEEREEGAVAGNLQTLANLRSVTLTANLSPLNYKRATRVDWYLVKDGVQTFLTSGKTLVYTPPATVGTYVLKASTLNAANEEIYDNYVVTVGYYPISALNAQFVQGDFLVGNTMSLVNGATLRLSIQNLQYALSTTTVKWYVDDQYVGDGAEFEYLFEQNGTYVVSAQINGATAVNKVMVVVADAEKQCLLNDGERAGVICAAWVAAMLLGLAAFLPLTILSHKSNGKADIKFD